MNKKVLVAGVSAVVVLTAAACGDSGSETATSPNGAGATSLIATSVAEENAAHNQADVMFAQMMIPHHEQAIEMSDIILAKNAIPASVTELAEQIKAAQGPEIEQLRSWLEQWDAPAMPGGDHDMPGMDRHMRDMPDMHEMEGMLSEEDLQQLSDAEGTEAARLFLRQMIAHHEGAVSMAETEIDDGQFPDAVAMAHTIVETQQDEIDTMRELLATL